MSSGIALMVTATPANADAEIHKSYVCKYVNTPGGGTELVQTGQNPIWVDNHSIAGKDTVSVGDKFSDKHGFSVVIVANTPKLDPEPGIDACAPGEPGDLLTTASVAFTDPNCANGNKASYATSGEHVTFDSPAAAPGANVTVTATPDEGYTIDGESSFSHTFAAAEADCNKIVVDPPTVVDPPKKHHTKTESTTTVTTPTVVHAGLAGTTVEDLRGEQGLALMFAGMVMMVAAGGLGLRVRGSAARI